LAYFNARYGGMQKLTGVFIRTFRQKARRAAEDSANPGALAAPRSNLRLFAFFAFIRGYKSSAFRSAIFCIANKRIRAMPRRNFFL
jgi:hypothetical protein